MGVDALVFADDNDLDIDHVMTLGEWTIGLSPTQPATASLTTRIVHRAGIHRAC